MINSIRLKRGFRIRNGWFVPYATLDPIRNPNPLKGCLTCGELVTVRYKFFYNYGDNYEECIGLCDRCDESATSSIDMLKRLCYSLTVERGDNVVRVK